MLTSSLLLACVGTAGAFHVSIANPSSAAARVGHQGSRTLLSAVSIKCSASGDEKGVVNRPAGRGIHFDALGIFGAAAVATSLAMSPLAAPAEVSTPSIYMAAVELPAGWESAVSEDGKEFYFNSKTGVSQWELPADAKKDDKKAKRSKSGSSSNNLNEIVQFKPPVVPVDRLTVKDKVTLEGACGETDFRSNSLECGEPAVNLIEDSVSKGVGTLESIMGEDGIKTLGKRAVGADTRGRMLMEAEMKSLSKTDLFKKLDSQTKDPERAAARLKKIQDITDANDLGSRRAPWSAPDDPVETGELPKLKFELKLPELKLPEIKLPKLF